MHINLESMAIEMPRVAGHPNRLPFRGVLTLLDVASDRAPAGARGHRVMLTRAAAEKALPSLLGMALDFTPNLDGHDARRKVGVITSAEIVPAAPDGKWQMENDKAGSVSAPPKPVAESSGFSPTLRQKMAKDGAPLAKDGAPSLRGASPGGGARRYVVRAGVWRLEIAGYIFARDFPEVVELMRGREVAEPTLRQNQAKDGAPAPNELGMSYEIANARVADVSAAVWILTEATFTGAAMLLRSKAAYPDTWIELEEQAIG